ncbi:MAG: hypothetical protein WAR57_06170 [Candidatus Phosphoribacter sp.]
MAAERSSLRTTGELTANGSFTNLVAWLADVDLEGKVADVLVLACLVAVAPHEGHR